jgi:hypothetical protein
VGPSTTEIATAPNAESTPAAAIPLPTSGGARNAAGQRFDGRAERFGREHERRATSAPQPSG